MCGFFFLIRLSFFSTHLFHSPQSISFLFLFKHLITTDSLKLKDKMSRGETIYTEIFAQKISTQLYFYTWLNNNGCSYAQYVGWFYSKFESWRIPNLSIWFSHGTITRFICFIFSYRRDIEPPQLNDCFSTTIRFR